MLMLLSVVLAGDIHLREKGVNWVIENIPNKPVIYILGNHEKLFFDHLEIKKFLLYTCHIVAVR
ncbi:hypothetical protein NUACC26_089180 [Scytonema sp. NUACC26]